MRLASGIGKSKISFDGAGNTTTYLSIFCDLHVAGVNRRRVRRYETITRHDGRADVVVSYCKAFIVPCELAFFLPGEKYLYSYGISVVI